MNQGPSYIPSFYFYKFAQGISSPYTALQAYQGGAIDENGNIVKPESSIDPVEYLIIKLKKIFEELPSGLTKAKLQNYMSTMQLFGEEVSHIGITEAEYIGLVESYLVLSGNTNISYMELLSEDMGAAGMASAGTSPAYDTGSVSGYDPAMGTTRRDEPVLKGFDACEMFDVCPEEMKEFKQAKAWKHVPESDTKRYLQRYQRRNPKSHIGLRSKNPDTGESDLYWVKFKPLSFMEEFSLDVLDILNEENDSMDGKKALNTAASAQYGAIAHFLDNHIRNLHGHEENDEIEVHTDEPDASPVKLKTGSSSASDNLRSYLKNTITSKHTTDVSDDKAHKPVSFTIKTKQGTIKANVPHVSAHGTPDLTINDPHVSPEAIKIDTKGARGRWEDQTGKFQDDNKKPVKVPVSEFDTGKPDKNSFVVLHDNGGNVTYVDHSNMPNVKKLLSKVYVKSGSSTRPGKFAMIGEIPLRLSQRGITKSALRDLDITKKDSDIVLQRSAQKNFADKFAELTNTKFGSNDLYTSLFKKKQ